MKTNVAFVKSLLLAVSFGLVVPLCGAPKAKSTPQTAPAKKEAAAEAQEEEAKIPGRVIQRANGSFLSLTVENNTLRLAFYDSQKKEMAPDVARVAARWNPRNKRGEERRILLPSGDGKTLASTPIQPPYNFTLYLTLLNDAGEAVETMNVSYSQSGE
ncbi:MAG: hypothetical protein QM790_18145 [Nibricoccus sp.]